MTWHRNQDHGEEQKPVLKYFFTDALVTFVHVGFNISNMITMQFIELFYKLQDCDDQVLRTVCNNCLVLSDCQDYSQSHMLWW